MLAGYTLLNPYALLALPLIGVLLILKRARPAPRTMFLPPQSFFKDAPASFAQFMTTKVSLILSVLFVLGITIGASHPARIIEHDLDSGRNIMLIVDVSPSMRARDFQENFSSLSRMEGVKKVVREFIQARTQDRIGLVVFGGRAFLQSPLTKDHRFLLDAVDALQPGIAGDGTAMGDAMGTALKRLQQLPAKTKTLVVVTDGASNAGQVQPQTAAEISQKLSIKIHTIGVGASNDNEAPFDEAVLRDVAATTEGIYRNAADIAALRSVTQEIEKLIETESRTTNSKTIEDFSWVGGLVALIAAAFSFLIRGILYPVASQRGVSA